MDEGDVAELLREMRAQRAETAALRAEIAAARAGAPPIAVPAITVLTLYGHYGPARQHEHSWRMMEDKLEPTIRLLGDLPAIELTPARWDKHLQVRRTEVMDYGRSRGKPPAESTLNIELGCAKVMLEWGVEHDYLAHNPLRRAKRGKTKGPRKTWLPEADLQVLLAAPEPRGDEQRAALHAWVLLKADTGLRFSEALAARRDRVRLTAEGLILDVDRTKGGKSHTVGLTERIVGALDRVPVVLGSPYFFTRRLTRKLYGKRTVYGWFRDACRSSGLDVIVVEGEIRVRPHDLRRSAASNANERGASLFDIQAMLNHSSPATTAKYIQRSSVSAVRLARLMADGAARERKAAQRTPQAVEKSGKPLISKH